MRRRPVLILEELLHRPVEYWYESDWLRCHEENSKGLPCRMGLNHAGVQVYPEDREVFAMDRKQKQQWSQHLCRYHYDPTIEPPCRVIVRFLNA